MTRYGLVDKDTGKVVNVIVWENSEWLPPTNCLVVKHDKIDRDDQYDFTDHTFTKCNCGTKHKLEVNNFHALVDKDGKIRNIIIRDDSDWTVPRNHKRVTVSANTKIGDVPQLADLSS